jgi:Uncharacterized protein conserved in archaea
MKLKVVVETEIRPTEDEERVLRAVTNIFDAEKVEIIDFGASRILVASSNSVSSLLKLHRAFRAERILDAARSVLKRGVRGSTIVFHLHKQAAYMGRVSFVDGDQESPLGAIRVTIHYSNPEDIIDWLAPPTSKGKPLWEKEMPA